MRLAVAGLLLVYAGAVLVLGARWLLRVAWPQWAPRVGIAAWLSGALSVVLSWVGGYHPAEQAHRQDGCEAWSAEREPR